MPPFSPAKTMYTGGGAGLDACHPSMWQVVLGYNVTFSGVTPLNLALIQFNSNNSYYKHRWYLTIIPGALMGYWLRGHEGKRNDCFSKIQLVGQK